MCGMTHTYTNTCTQTHTNTHKHMHTLTHACKQSMFRHSIKYRVLKLSPFRSDNVGTAGKLHIDPDDQWNNVREMRSTPSTAAGQCWSGLVSYMGDTKIQYRVWRCVCICMPVCHRCVQQKYHILCVAVYVCLDSLCVCHSQGWFFINNTSLSDLHPFSLSLWRCGNLLPVTC